MNVRQMTAQDIHPAAEVHKAAFVRQSMSQDWIQCNFNAYPRMQLFVAEEEGVIAGYIHWTQRSGFRPTVVLELEQLAVHPDFQGRGIGTRLMEDIEARFARADHYEVFTGHLSERNLRLYGRLGYEESSRRPVSEGLTIVVLQKAARGSR